MNLQKSALNGDGLGLGAAAELVAPAAGGKDGEAAAMLRIGMDFRLSLHLHANDFARRKQQALVAVAPDTGK